jgi:hypothetical protein
LSPEIIKSTWSKQEEMILSEKHLEFGNQWTKISKFLPGRSDNAVKNFYYSKFRKFLRQTLKEKMKDQAFSTIPYDSVDPNKLYKIIRKKQKCFEKINKQTLIPLILENFDHLQRKVILNTFNSFENSEIKMNTDEVTKEPQQKTVTETSFLNDEAMEIIVNHEWDQKICEFQEHDYSTSNIFDILESK